MSEAEWDFQKIHAEYRPRVQLLQELKAHCKAEDWL